MREWLLRRLALYTPFDDREGELRAEMQRFVGEHADPFRRELVQGHVTGSAWVVDPGREHVLLVWHRKLGKWLQPGGHIEGDPSVLESARREAREETGVEDIRSLSEDIFDLDIHPIPATPKEPAHLHYDVRFLFEADRDETPVVSPESREVAWIRLEDAGRFNSDESMRRMMAKTK